MRKRGCHNPLDLEKLKYSIISFVVLIFLCSLNGSQANPPMRHLSKTLRLQDDPGKFELIVPPVYAQKEPPQLPPPSSNDGVVMVPPNPRQSQAPPPGNSITPPVANIVRGSTNITCYFCNILFGPPGALNIPGIPPILPGPVTQFPGPMQGSSTATSTQSSSGGESSTASTASTGYSSSAFTTLPTSSTTTSTTMKEYSSSGLTTLPTSPTTPSTTSSTTPSTTSSTTPSTTIPTTPSTTSTTPSTTSPTTPSTTSPTTPSTTTASTPGTTIIVVTPSSPTTTSSTTPFPIEPPTTTPNPEEPGSTDSSVETGSGGDDHGEQDIYQGYPAQTGWFPFAVQVSVSSSDKKTECSGSIFNEFTIITAASCLTGATNGSVVSPSSVMVYAGNAVRNQGIPRQARQLKIHPNFKGGASTSEDRYDIALILLGEPYIQNDRDVGSIKIAPNTKLDAGSYCLLAAYGSQTGNEGSPWGNLQYSPMIIRNTSDCTSAYPNTVFDPEISVCAGGNGASRMCTGDEGGPLACLYDNNWMLYGVADLAKKATAPNTPCSQPAPGTYAYVPYFKSWINANARWYRRR